MTPKFVSLAQTSSLNSQFLFLTVYLSPLGDLISIRLSKFQAKILIPLSKPGPTYLGKWQLHCSDSAQAKTLEEIVYSFLFLTPTPSDHPNGPPLRIYPESGHFLPLPTINLVHLTPQFLQQPPC